MGLYRDVIQVFDAAVRHFLSAASGMLDPRVRPARAHQDDSENGACFDRESA